MLRNIDVVALFKRTREFAICSRNQDTKKKNLNNQARFSFLCSAKSEIVAKETNLVQYNRIHCHEHKAPEDLGDVCFCLNERIFKDSL